MFETIIHRYLRLPYGLHIRKFHKVKRAKVTVLFLHGIGGSGMMWEKVIDKLPDSVQYLSVDLLGFGDSPKPDWATYDAGRQARSVLATYLKLAQPTPVIIVGHSLGSLVGIEIAKRYPLLVKELVLCAPPLYHQESSQVQLPRRADRLLRKLYEQASKYPSALVQLGKFVTKYKLVNPSFTLTNTNLHAYLGALEAAVINQTALDDALKLRHPIHLLYGSLDPVVLYRNLRFLASKNPSVTLRRLPTAGHEIKGPMVTAAAKAIISAIYQLDRVQ